MSPISTLECLVSRPYDPTLLIFEVFVCSPCCASENKHHEAAQQTNAPLKSLGLNPTMSEVRIFFSHYKNQNKMCKDRGWENAFLNPLGSLDTWSPMADDKPKHLQ